MNRIKIASAAGRVFAAVMLAAALALTFTVADYYIFNRMEIYGAFAAAQVPDGGPHRQAHQPEHDGPHHDGGEIGGKEG